ncbi:MAG: TonB-dependent receptor [Bacteroidetes bacterium]|nr:TonB-dependent receptor [Bacteroidota bacterium]
MSKGVASVINGNESISGQINIELKKPETAEDLYINGYLSSDMKAEVNADAVISPGKGWTSLFLIHGENNSEPIDNNKDNFLDIPMTKQLHFMNRWDYENHGKYESKTAIQLMTEDRTGGTIPGTENQATDYPISIKNNRAHFFTKNGFVSQKPGTSLGTIVSGTYHDVQANIGNNKYSGLQKSVYANLIYQTIIKNTNHEISSGASFNGDDYSESLNDSTFARTDIIPGAFVQYTWRHLDNITLMAAYRADYNSSFGVFHTPRVHLRYAPVKNHTFRLSAGKGYRIPSVIAENMGYLASSRELTVLEEAKPEDAINAGISYFWEFKINGNTSSFVADYFHTYFINMYNADPDLDARHIYFYNVHNNARANSYQAELNLQPVKRLEVLLAARYNDVMGFSGNKIQAKPLVSPFKMVASVSYRTKFDKWQFDGTVHHLGGGRIPVTTGNPAEFTRSNKFPSYSTVYAQITRRFKHWEWYLGGENLTNFKQKDPVIAASDPNGQFFDASLIWGPVQGRMLYFGFRFILK